MKNVCLYFKIHQPFRLKRYRFFDIGNDHYYYDDFTNDEIITRLAEQSYIPMAKTLLDMIRENGKDFRFALSITGTAIEQLQLYVPEFIGILKELADTGFPFRDLFAFVGFARRYRRVRTRSETPRRPDTLAFWSKTEGIHQHGTHI